MSPELALVDARLAEHARAALSGVSTTYVRAEPVNPRAPLDAEAPAAEQALRRLLDAAVDFDVASVSDGKPVRRFAALVAMSSAAVTGVLLLVSAAVWSL